MTATDICPVCGKGETEEYEYSYQGFPVQGARHVSHLDCVRTLRHQHIADVEALKCCGNCAKYFPEDEGCTDRDIEDIVCLPWSPCQWPENRWQPREEAT